MEEASQGIRPLIEEIIQQFPGVTTAFAYGSGVFHQHGYSSKDVPMIDLVFGVKHSAQWHRDNIAAHPSHYSSVRHFGPKIIELLQDRIGAGLYYNTLVPMPTSSGSVRIKYGVIDQSRMAEDLTQWKTFYLAGRLQKPVAFLRGGADMAPLNQKNREMALAAALLQLPERFSMRDLLETIVGLSYAGDFRMIFGENPRKVQNIVKGHFSDLSAIYFPMLRQLQSAGKAHVTNATSSPSVTVYQDMSGGIRAELVESLPRWLAEDMNQRWLASIQAFGPLKAVSRVPITARMRRLRAQRSLKRIERRNRHGNAAGLIGDEEMKPGAVHSQAASLQLSFFRSNSSPFIAKTPLGQSLCGRPHVSAELTRSLLRPSLATVVGRYARTQVSPVQPLAPCPVPRRFLSHQMEQSLKGILTAGIGKSVVYSAAKISKMLKK